MVSAFVNTVLKEKENTVSMDFYAVCIYALAAMGDLQFRFCTTCDIKRDLQAQASLHIAFASFLCFSIIFAFCQLAFEVQEGKLLVNALFGPKRFQVWAAFLFIVIVQLLSLVNSSSIIGLSLMMDVFFAGLSAWFVMPPVSIVKPLPGFLLYYSVDAMIHDLRNDTSSWPLSPPQSGSSISDMDQILSLVTTVTLLAIQWKARHRVLDLFYLVKRRMNWNDGEEREEDDNEGESGDDEPLLPLPVTKPSSSV
jgi:hypothetical protein